MNFTLAALLLGILLAGNSAAKVHVYTSCINANTGCNFNTNLRVASDELK